MIHVEHSELYEAVTRSSQEKNEKIKLTSGRKSYASSSWMRSSKILKLMHCDVFSANKS